MLARLRSDIQCILDRDPAARSTWEVITCYPGLHAIWLHRPGRTTPCPGACSGQRVYFIYNRPCTPQATAQSAISSTCHRLFDCRKRYTGAIEQCKKQCDVILLRAPLFLALHGGCIQDQPWHTTPTLLKFMFTEKFLCTPKCAFRMCKRRSGPCGATPVPNRWKMAASMSTIDTTKRVVFFSPTGD